MDRYKQPNNINVSIIFVKKSFSSTSEKSTFVDFILLLYTSH